MKNKSPKPKIPTSQPFQAARFLWQMAFSYETFIAVKAGVDHLLASEMDVNDVVYYPLSVGLVCLYARPFTNNDPVGPLSTKIVPKQLLHLHETLMQMRHKIFAHADASPIAGDVFANELIFESKKIDDLRRRIRLPTPILFRPRPEFLRETAPLLEILIEKTGYHTEKAARRLYRCLDPDDELGEFREFRLNVLDASKPLLSGVTTREEEGQAVDGQAN